MSYWTLLRPSYACPCGKLDCHYLSLIASQSRLTSIRPTYPTHEWKYPSSIWSPVLDASSAFQTSLWRSYRPFPASSLMINRNGAARVCSIEPQALSPCAQIFVAVAVPPPRPFVLVLIDATTSRLADAPVCVSPDSTLLFPTRLWSSSAYGVRDKGYGGWGGMSCLPERRMGMKIIFLPQRDVARRPPAGSEVDAAEWTVQMLQRGRWTLPVKLSFLYISLPSYISPPLTISLLRRHGPRPTRPRAFPGPCSHGDLCSHNEIRRLSLVCKRFRIISLPVLFKHQSLDLAAREQRIDQDKFADRLDYMRRSAVRVENLTNPSSAALPLIESWRVKFGYEHALGLSSKKQDIDIEDLRLFNKPRARIMESFCKTLHLYPNLSSLDMERYAVDTAFLTTLAGLPALRDLRLHIPDKSSVSYSGGNLTLPKLRRLDISRHAMGSRRG
ncbi:hypothetical protein R3P38DRAFT_3170657 [Favolaschia claudopus]|uniref:F-box domain-containing protein n=1 Tax=Favolaschia claudopus TaxID=2862362 RepID=A0AAW0DTB9_9AGAR